MSWDCYSKIYLDATVPKEQLLTLLGQWAGGTPHLGSIVGPVLDIHVLKNDAHWVLSPDPDDFIQFPFLVDVSAADGVSAENYKDALDSFLRQLAQPGWRFVTAAEDEPALWNGGRWDGRAAPARDEPDSS